MTTQKKPNDWTQYTPVSQNGYALRELTDRGAVYARYFDEPANAWRRGWWLDGIWLAESARDAIRIINGAS